MTRTRLSLFAAIVLGAAVGWPAAHVHACQASAPWLVALKNAARPSHGGTLPEDVIEQMFRKAGAPALFAMPAVGPAPLGVKLVFFYRPVPEPATVEIVVDGGGAPAQRSPAGRYNEHTSFALAREGRYDVTARVRSSGQPDFIATAVVTVLSRAAFAQQLAAHWAAFGDRLRRRDLRGALDCVSVSDRERNEPMMRAAANSLAWATGQKGRFTYQRMDREGAFCTMPAVDEQGRAYEATVKFVPDLDGVWRLRYS